MNEDLSLFTNNPVKINDIWQLFATRAVPGVYPSPALPPRHGGIIWITWNISIEMFHFTSNVCRFIEGLTFKISYSYFLRRICAVILWHVFSSEKGNLLDQQNELPLTSDRWRNTTVHDTFTHQRSKPGEQ